MPIRHDRKVRVHLDAPAHRVTLKDGQTFGVSMVSVNHRIEYNGPEDPTWVPRGVWLVRPRGPALNATDLREVPEWLESIIARAEPIDP